MCTYSDLQNQLKNIVGPAYQFHPNGTFIQINNTGYSTFTSNMWSGYQALLQSSGSIAGGCQFWTNKFNIWQSTYNSGINPNTGNPLSNYQKQILLAKMQFAQAMHVECGCPGPAPQIVGPPTSSLTNSKLNNLSNLTCTFTDIKNQAGMHLWPVYSAHPSQPMSTWYPNFLGFQQNMWNHYQASGCSWWVNRAQHWTSQLSTITNQYNLQLKLAKILFAQSMHALCGCGGTVPIVPSGQNLKTIDGSEISSMKEISDFIIDYKTILASGEKRNFIIEGDIGAIFSLEIKNEDGHYYNFKTNSFQSGVSRLSNIVLETNQYKGIIKFPKITDDDHYDISIFAEENTKHSDYIEKRFGDNSLDLNSTKGSSSKLMNKILYQYTDKVLTISPYSVGGTVEVGSPTSKTITLSREGSTGKIPFSISFSVSTNTKSYQIIKQPTVGDAIAFVTRTVGAAPVQLLGENIYPDISDTDTVDGAVTSGRKVVMDNNVASNMKVGDRITGNAALNATTVTVSALNPDGDNVKEFSMSEAIALADGLTLSFSNQVNYQWPLDNVDGLAEDMVLVPDTNVTSGTSISNYVNSLTIMENTLDEDTLVLNEAPAIFSEGIEPTITNGEVATQVGNVVFNKQQVLALAEDSVKIGGYGLDIISQLYGYDVTFSDLKIELTKITTTTTSSTVGSASTSVAVASRNGILDNVSLVSGIGIDASTANPKVASGAGSVAGAGTIVLSAAQELESGVTLTFEGAGQTATITGNIEISKVGSSNQTIRFDVDKLVSIT